MSNEKYFIINNSDGDTTVDVVNKEELLARVKDNYYGNYGYKDSVDSCDDTNMWGCQSLIIKGEIVTPKPIEVVTKYNID